MVRKCIPLALALALALVLAASPLADAAAHRSQSAFGHRHVASPPSLELVPVRACPTATGTAWPKGPKIPRNRVIAEPPSIARQVAVYTDEFSVQSVLGPRGWKCVASYGADGSGGITVYAPNEHSPGFFPHFTSNKSGLRGIHVFAQPSCVGCYLEMACPYFKRALMRVQRWFHGPVPAACRVPKSERVRALSDTLVSAIDPPHVIGNNYPSGGALFAIGNVFFSDSKDEQGPSGSYFMTCALPSRDHSLCYASLNWFAKHWEG
jgi:hypothetical protein